MTVRIRKPGDKDLLEFTRLALEYTETQTRSFTNNHQEKLRERKYWAADCIMEETPAHYLRLAEQNGIVYGYVLASMTSSHTGWIEEIFVREWYRHTCVGTKLIQSAIEWMEEQGTSMLYATDKGDTGFLRAHGFEKRDGHYQLKLR
ncbi:GNAT family N-acetyltransferase [Thalassobacillus sp. CUG 92003]|uniref:GNAT family N-acetyltransferase n=1 Tax=Thalassobacillus sp. CUG 92003 TaxID=2736641 RepID=UPI0015E6D83A|nr:GNAT family N-acetyltransferase [Thalassobacillus sp. CUG 92003]